MAINRPLAREIAPFGATALLGFALVPVGNRVEWTGYWLAAAVMLATGCVAVLAPWRALPRAARVVPPLMFLVAAALLRDAGGGTASGVAALAVVPVFWLALHGGRGELLFAITSVCGFFVAPRLLIGDPAYPSASWRIAVIFAVASAIIGLAVQDLVRRVRSNAEALAVRERDLAAMAELSRSLSDTADARERICAAACDLSGAQFAVLLEGRRDGTLARTAGAGLAVPATAFTAKSGPSWAMAAYC
jgi:hypothetical protein